MSEVSFPVDNDVDGPAAPPRANGELMFEEAWEARAFGMVVALHQSGLFEWETFRKELICEIGAWDKAHPDGEGYSYYERWLAAFERLAEKLDLLKNDALAERIATLAARPHGHDHQVG